MVNKNCDAQVPANGALTADDDALLSAAAALLPKVRANLDAQAFHLALEDVWVVVRAANGYVDKQAPWALRKNDPARMQTVLYVLAETVRRIALLMQPFVPDSAAKLLDQLAVDPDQRTFKHFDEALGAGTVLPAPAGVFPRHVEEAGKGAA
jgi:methionyl-tRNA synthetase